MKHDEDSAGKVELEKLLKYRELEIESCLKMGEIALAITCHYKVLAEELGKTNPIAKTLPAFTLSLLDKQGSFGSIEYAIKNELLNNP